MHMNPFPTPVGWQLPPFKHVLNEHTFVSIEKEKLD